MMRYEKCFEVGDRVRIKLNKGKSSTPNWSSSIYPVSKVIPRRNAIAEKHSVKGKEKMRTAEFSRNELQIVEGEPNEVPNVNNSGRLTEASSRTPVCIEVLMIA